MKSSNQEQQASVVGVDYARLFLTLPTAYLVMAPDFTIVDANPAYLRLTNRNREDLLGRYAFDAFPPTADSLDADGCNPVQRSFEAARDQRCLQQIPMTQYDLLDVRTGAVEHRYWSLICVPVLGPGDEVELILQRVEDVTDLVQDRRQGHDARPDGRRLIEVPETDLYARAQELRDAITAEAQATRRLAAMAEVALQLAATETVEQVVDVVAGAGLRVLGARGAGLCLVTETGTLRMTTTGTMGPTARHYADLPADSDTPAAWVARTGTPLVLPSRADGVAWSATMTSVYDASGLLSWVVVPLRITERVIGSLVAGWRDERTFTVDEVEMVTVFASQCAQTLERVQTRAQEQLEVAQTRQISEALQRSLLTDPPRLDRLQVAVRYLPASSGVQVGGDWYDAFSSTGGATTLVVGDVTGHDLTAAAAMGQIRNLLRGVAHMVDSSPSTVLSALDRTLTSLGVDTLATATLAHVRTVDERSAAFTWSSAGHPPPLLVDPQGRAAFLEVEADLLLGLDPATERSDHRVVLAAGASILLYTDGLIERRGESLDVGLERLRVTAAELAFLPIDAFCDQLLIRLADRHLDDIALLAVRLEGVHP